jgi:curved DNA-binding protein CbpA
MNIEPMPAETVKRAEGSLKGGDGRALCDAANSLLQCAGGDHTGETINGAPVLNRILKRLQEDPYRCLGVSKTSEASEVKKAYRKLALQYHPDKNADKTTALFTEIQRAYTLLSDDKKRKSYDLRRQRKEAQAEKLRKRKKDEEQQKREGSPSMGMRRPPSTNSFHMPPQSEEEKTQRDFNRKFYSEYKQHMTPAGSSGAGTSRPPPPSGAPPSEGVKQAPRGSAGAATPSSPPPPKPTHLRVANKTDSTVTLEWKAGVLRGGAVSKAYELQWRKREGKDQGWQSASQLILHTTCRKRNLDKQCKYQFRVRAASVAGWSPHSDVCDVATLNGPGSQQPPPSELPPLHTNEWACTVCKRPNASRESKCSICGTRKGYDGPSTQKPSPEKRDDESVASRASKTSKRSKVTSDDDDDWGLDGEETWAFTDKDVPPIRPKGNPVFDYGDRPPRQPLSKPPKPTYWLNTAATQLHNVRFEPVKGSPIVGHLVQDTEIEVIAEAGTWIKCRYHRAYKPLAGQPAPPKPKNREGWCLKYGENCEYVVDDGHAYPKQPDAPDEEEVIYELRDDDDRLYYFNSYTGVSMWEPPEWTDSVDPASGAVYYTHSVTGETQWERPFDFVPIVREELYTTPQARFIKSILSPKRSHANMNHIPTGGVHLPGVGPPRA